MLQQLYMTLKLVLLGILGYAEKSTQDWKAGKAGKDRRRRAHVPTGDDEGDWEPFCSTVYRVSLCYPESCFRTVQHVNQAPPDEGHRRGRRGTQKRRQHVRVASTRGPLEVVTVDDSRQKLS